MLGRAVLASGLAGCGLAWWARHAAPYRAGVERIELQVPAGHEGLAGLRIGFVTDTHVGPMFSGADLARAVAPLAAGRPDLLLFGGDYVSEAPRHVAGAAPVLGRLARAAPLGAYAVLGNHDLAMGGARVAAALEAEGVPVLRDAAAEVRTPGGPLWIVGLNGVILGEPDPDAAFAAVPTGAAALALWHEPDRAEAAAARGAFAQLSGHTHGGQVRVPVLGPLSLPVAGRRYVMGRYDVDGMALHVSRGVGVYRPPVRFRCRPEVTVVELVARPT